MSGWGTRRDAGIPAGQKGLVTHPLGRYNPRRRERKEGGVDARRKRERKKGEEKR